MKRSPSRGLIDNSRFIDNYKRHHGYGVEVYGDGTWPPLELGSENAVFVENSYFRGNRHTIASNNGSRFVFRHNQIVDNREDATRCAGSGRARMCAARLRASATWRSDVTVRARCARPTCRRMTDRGAPGDVPVGDVRRGGAAREQQQPHRRLRQLCMGIYPNGAPAMLTDGVTDSAHYVQVGGSGAQWTQVDLEAAYALERINLRHYHADGRRYEGVIVQLSTDGTSWTTVFNNDTANRAGQGIGADATYAETAQGKDIVLAAPVQARYVRAWANGSNVNPYSHWVELEVYGP